MTQTHTVSSPAGYDIAFYDDSEYVEVSGTYGTVMVYCQAGTWRVQTYNGHEFARLDSYSAAVTIAGRIVTEN